MSLRGAIDAKCRDCIYDEHAPGTWRAQVAQCSAITCPLWPVRPAPYQGDFANPPRDPINVPREWVIAPLGQAISPKPLPVPAENEQTVEPEPVMANGAEIDAPEAA